jgi:hypothetical protein
MKTTSLLGKFAMFVAIVSFGFVISCKEDTETVNGQDLAEAGSESLSDSYYEDVDDMSLYAVEHESPAGAPGRKASDGRFCAAVQFNEDADAASGTAIVDFSNNDLGYCTDAKGNIRKGKIQIDYSGGPIGTVGFTVVITFIDYSINGIALKGIRTIERLSGSTEAVVKHQITLSNGIATWPDNTAATRTSDFTREWTVETGIVRVDGSAFGTGRQGKSYVMDIAKTLVYKKECAESEGIYMAVEGTKIFTVNSKPITIDFGAGACDRTVTVTVKNISREFTVNKN